MNKYSQARLYKMSEYLPEILAYNYLVDASKGQAKFHECIKAANTAGEKSLGILII